MRGSLPLLLLAACAGDAAEDLESLPLTDQARQAVSRLRFAPVHIGDRVERGDVLLSGPGDEVTVAFSRRLVVQHLGIDAEQLLPELFSGQTENEVFLEIGPSELVRLELPQGIGATVPHPIGRVRDVQGTPSWSGDLRAIETLFDTGAGVRELFARTPPAEPVEPEPWKRRRVLGVVPFPRMGPPSGVVIERVMPGSPADKAGLGTGDKITGVNGAPVKNLDELKLAMQTSRGPEVLLRVKRAGGGEVDVPVRLE